MDLPPKSKSVKFTGKECIQTGYPLDYLVEALSLVPVNFTCLDLGSKKALVEIPTPRKQYISYQVWRDVIRVSFAVCRES